MADEISITTTLRVISGGINDSLTRSFSTDMAETTAPAKAGGIISVGFATHEAVSIGDITNAGWALFENLDDTNFIQVGALNSTTFVPLLKLMPGESQFVRLATNAPYAKADTAACRMNYEIWEA